MPKSDEQRAQEMWELHKRRPSQRASYRGSLKSLKRIPWAKFQIHGSQAQRLPDCGPLPVPWHALDETERFGATAVAFCRPLVPFGGGTCSFTGMYLMFQFTSLAISLRLFCTGLQEGMREMGSRGWAMWLQR